MTPDDLRAARRILGARWNLGRELRMSELGRAVRMPGKDPGQSIRDYEDGITRIPGPLSAAVDMLLNGAEPPDGVAVIRKAG
jgi:hypothetical protein